MFPEGTRQTKGLRKKFEHRPRIGLGADRARPPACRSSRRRSRARDRLSRLPQAEGRLRRAGPLDDLAELPPRDAHQDATDRLMERIYALHEEL